MSRLRSTALAAVLLAACRVRAPAPIAIDPLVAAHGTADARFTLTARVLADPRDVAARLALAELDAATRPASAIVQLEAVIALGGPLGTRWHDADRARLGALLAARGRARLARGAAAALADLARARVYGATIGDDELGRAHAAIALAELRSVEPARRATGRLALGALAASPIADASWRGAGHGATAAQVGAFGSWLWHAGARRAALDELRAWAAQVQPARRDPALQAIYLDALAWWLPFSLGEVAPPATAELVGAARCQFPGAPHCTAVEVIGGDAEAALARAPIAARTRDPAEALAWTKIAIHAWQRGNGALGPAIAARVDVAALAHDPALRGLLGALAGEGPSASDRDASPELTAAIAALAAHDVHDAAPTTPAADPRADAAARAVIARLGDDPATGMPTAAQLREVAAAMRIDPASAERLGRELAAASPDGEAGNAAIGALFLALGDPARARVAWQAAVEGSPEPAFVRGLAEACARAGDGDAALVNGAVAAAASGDPAVVWVAIARALADDARAYDAIDAAHRATELGGPRELAAALDIEITASQIMGHAAQAATAAAQRARLAPALAHADTAAADPSNAPAALAAYRTHPDPATLARLVTAARLDPHDVTTRAALRAALPPGDPRRAQLEAELVTLAGDPDLSRGLEAVQALR